MTGTPDTPDTPDEPVAPPSDEPTPAAKLLDEAAEMGLAMAAVGGPDHFREIADACRAYGDHQRNAFVPTVEQRANWLGGMVRIIQIIYSHQVLTKQFPAAAQTRALLGQWLKELDTLLTRIRKATPDAVACD